MKEKKEKIKVVFLDIDGVVATMQSLNNELSEYFGIDVTANDDDGPGEWCENSGLPYPFVSMWHWPFVPMRSKKRFI